MPKRLVFKIAEADPHKISMTRLLEYLTELATILGSRESVHFLAVEEGSAPCVMEVDSDEEEQIIVSRVQEIVKGLTTQEAQQAHRRLQKLLRDDDFSAELLTDRGDVILDFPAEDAQEVQAYGPFWQDGALDGILMKIGGMDETIPVHLLYEGTHYKCNANVEMARRLGHHLLQKPIRVYGRGQWYRNTNGKWELRWFNILDFEELVDSSLPDVVSHLRAIPGNELASLRDPLEEMRKIRHGE